MKKTLLLTLCFSSLLLANSEIQVSKAYKDFDNSKDKTTGDIHELGLKHKFENSKINFLYENSDINRENKTLNKKLEDLEVKKYSLKYDYDINKVLKTSASYIKIDDNLAPTDKGEIYGLSLKRNFKSFTSGLGFYYSDYKTFNNRQIDLTNEKRFKIDNFKIKLQMINKYIDIDGSNFASYKLKENNYFTTALNASVNYNNYIVGVGTYLGKRAFTVFADGLKVQHHAKRIDKEYSILLGKKFKNLDIFLKYVQQDGFELAKNQDDVETKVGKLIVKYRF